jgi:hypothetical protein
VWEDRRTKLNWTVTLAKNKMVVITNGGPSSNGRRVTHYQAGTVLGFDLSPWTRKRKPKE